MRSESAKMKGLFKPKPRTPVDVVRQTRELLMFADRSSDTREGKREEKVRTLFPIVSNLIPISTSSILVVSSVVLNSLAGSEMAVTSMSEIGAGDEMGARMIKLGFSKYWVWYCF